MEIAVIYSDSLSQRSQLAAILHDGNYSPFNSEFFLPDPWRFRRPA